MPIGAMILCRAGRQPPKTFLDRAATDKIKMLGFHWPYPGIGYAEKKGTGYAYVAVS